MTVAVWEGMRRRPLGFVVSGWVPRCWAFLLSGVLVGLAVLLLLVALLFVGVSLSVVGIGPSVVGGLAALVAVAVSGIPVAALERRRLRIVEPEPLPAPRGSSARTGASRWLRTRLREAATWRELAYTLVLGVVLTATGLAFAALLGLSAMLTAAPVIVWALAPETVMIIPGRAVPHPLAALPASAVGLLGLLVSAYAGGLLSGAHVWVARSLLSAREDSLRSRVVELTRSRARLADAFEAERRRIERDLHDGAQQQLVALSMTLGLAELELREQDSPAAPLVARARGEARQALDQLRSLVRGIHPQVLTDHGLPAAVGELALRNPVPVTVDIDLPHRLPTAVETTAYFTVTEALTNASKHSGADHVTVTGRLRDGTLVLDVTDDGHGGADPDAGAGLRGLADRLAILGGTLTVTSPVGGPTRLRAEVPCSA
ncbi:sensor histidine kinase [Streptomyces thermolilacinus]|uniref:histidine kinase n=1 Tax=Streptomyces thermolilacinus SPC6 TaxID=1306406 RepID=A0A1D3DNM5_9ACTN|nr:sensor histidine kinase [Streptomyces thermolilacinus]OEJ93928.1 histidine kinase [Streptomyces thermolilacinus SPC6]